MKKAEDIILEIEPDSDGFQPYYRYDEVVKAIKQAQIDAIEEAVKRCAEKALIASNFDSVDSARTHSEQFLDEVFSIDEQSILKVAEQLRKEIE